MAGEECKRGQKSTNKRYWLQDEVISTLKDEYFGLCVTLGVGENPNRINRGRYAVVLMTRHQVQRIPITGKNFRCWNVCWAPGGNAAVWTRSAFSQFDGFLEESLAGHFWMTHSFGRPNEPFGLGLNCRFRENGVRTN